MNDAAGFPDPLVVDGVQFARWKSIKPPGRLARELNPWRILGLASLACAWFALATYGYMHNLVSHPNLSRLILIGMFLPLPAMYLLALFRLVFERRGQTKALLRQPEGVPSYALSASISCAAADKGALGMDRGWLWVDNGKLVFQGENCRFWIGPEDFAKPKGLERCFWVGTRSVLVVPNGLNLRIGLWLLSPRGKPDSKLAGKHVLPALRLQPAATKPSRLPPIEYDHEPDSILGNVVTFLPASLSAIPIVMVSWLATWLSPVALPERFQSLWQHALVAFPVMLLLSMVFVADALIEKAYRRSLEKTLAKYGVER